MKGVTLDMYIPEKKKKITLHISQASHQKKKLRLILPTSSFLDCWFKNGLKHSIF